VSGNGRDRGHDFADDEPTPVERGKKRRTEGLIMIEPPPIRETTPSDHPRVKTAKIHHSTVTTVVASLVIGGLAYAQQWPYEVTLGALGIATGLWAVGALKR